MLHYFNLKLVRDSFPPFHYKEKLIVNTLGIFSVNPDGV